MDLDCSENITKTYGTKTTQVTQSGGDVRVYCYEDGKLIKEAVCPTLEYAEKYAYNYEKGLVFLG